jgi:Protein of unknown function (DUF1822)
MNFAFAEPTEWWLEITPDMRAAAWEQQLDATPASRWNAYLNRICLAVFLPWLQADYAPEATACPAAAGLGRAVTGTAIQVGTTRIVLVPSESIDSSELEVPQEWLDIPSWAADYYLAVQVQLTDQLDSQWLRVWGYTTHRELKTIGRYDPDDRTYSLAAPDLTQDLNAFWVTLQVCPEAQTRAAIAPLPELSAIQTENLLQRLNRPEVAFPRLAVPFELWGALLEASRRINLSQWFQQRVEAGWQTLEALFGTAPDRLAFGFRSAAETEDPEVTQGKVIEFATQSVLLLVGLQTEADQRIGITAQIHPDRGNPYVPAYLTLALLSETGESLQAVQATEADNYIQLRRFRCAAGTRFQLQVTLDDRSITEDFIA